MIDAMALADELKPCPFCGSSPKNTEYFGNYNKASWVVHCADCDLSLNGDDTPEAAAKRWNTRAMAQPAVTTGADDAWHELLERTLSAYDKTIDRATDDKALSDSGRDTIINSCIASKAAVKAFVGNLKFYAALPAANMAGDVRAHRVMTPESMIERHLPDVRCVGCGSNWNSADLAAAKAADPKIISCCPERKPLDITGWMARAIALEEKLRLALSTPTPAPAVSDPLEALVSGFANALLKKLRLSAANGRTGWDRDDWEKECQQGLLRHVAKGDPRDVAAYCAFMWHHDWITVPAAPAVSGDVETPDAG